MRFIALWEGKYEIETTRQYGSTCFGFDRLQDYASHFFYY